MSSNSLSEHNPKECKHYRGGVCARSQRCYRPCLLKCNVNCSDFIPKHTCQDCAYIVTDEGEPYYCAMKDLYTFVGKDDVACSEFVSKNE